MGALKIIACIVICQFVGFLGSFFTAPAIPTWYAALNKPSFTPPNWVFGPVWITLYLMMGISAYLVWRLGLNEPGVKTALLLFGLQLALNALWSPVFFGLKSPLAGAAVIILLWIVLLATIMVFFNLSRISAILLIPYILWVSYAAVLNISIMILNS
ncbi:MAG: tryptophan-rich sensory protein [Gemmatimonadota bacterium]|nr:MAG: tryptophan-rich sensory protein [Gemmatimonadota bacterium]